MATWKGDTEQIAEILEYFRNYSVSASRLPRGAYENVEKQASGVLRMRISATPEA